MPDQYLHCTGQTSNRQKQSGGEDLQLLQEIYNNNNNTAEK